MKKRLSIIIAAAIGIILAITITLGAFEFSSQPAPHHRETHSAKITVNQFIKQVAPAAQREQRKYHIPASITIAQAGTESNWGRSKLAYKYNNLFGIKGEGANSKVLSTKEYTNGKWVVIKGRFRVYDSWAESIKDHTQLMVKGTAYNEQNYQAVIDATNYQEAARALQKAGYATDPDYAAKLINVIKTYQLDRYDQ